MPQRLLQMAALGLGLCLSWQSSGAQEKVQHVHHQVPRTCPPGHVIIEEVILKEVCHEMCKLVPDVLMIKKWAYCFADVPFCVHSHDHKSCGHDDCHGGSPPHCAGPYHKKVLIKREVIVEERPTTKCVIEKVTEMVPCKTYRIIPCGQVPPGAVVVPASLALPDSLVPSTPPVYELPYGPPAFPRKK